MASSIVISTDLSVRFLCGLRGYHVYREEWTPTLNELLCTIHERNNIFDHYAIAARKRLPGRLVESTVGHLPKEISRVTRFIILYGAIVVVKVKDTQHRRSPLIQGGLEIPIEVIVKMEYSLKNKDAMAKYDSIISHSYKEPVDGNFEDISDVIQIANDSESSESDGEEPEDI